MSVKYDKKIINTLLDKYERSKTYTGTAQVNQLFAVKPEELFKGYEDESQYDLFTNVNESIREIEILGLVKCKRKKNEIVTRVELIIDKLDICYEYLKRTPKKQCDERLVELLNRYKDDNEYLAKYCAVQLDRINQNKKVELFDGDFGKYENVLKCVSAITLVEEEMYIRNFSIRTLGDSKAFEDVKSKVVTILFEYGDFLDKESVLEEMNIVKNPGYVYFKGKGYVILKGEILNFEKLGGSFGISSCSLDDIEEISVLGSRVVTIENLTTFNTFDDDDAFVIYLGGYHNAIRRRFILDLYNQNKDKDYYHFGDIDAGGFNIIFHLRRLTGINFRPMYMDVEMLKQYARYTKKLTYEDKNRLEKMKDSEFVEVIEYMIENDCKLEQEAIEFFEPIKA